MKVFRNILVYAETADADCLAQVVDLAERHGAALSVCDVIEPAPRLSSDAVGHLKALDWKLAFERLRSLCGPHLSRLALDYSVLTGYPFLAVTEQVIQQHFDLVVHISEPGGEGGGARLNPTGMHLVRKCPCAVWTLHPQQPRETANMLLAVDRDVVSDGDRVDGFSLELAATAASLASARGARLHLLHAWTPYGERLLEHPQAGLSTTDVDSYLDAQRADHEAWFERMVERVRCRSEGVELCAELRQGPAAQLIPELARELDAELVIMGTIGTSSVPGVLIGTTAEAVLSATTTPVFALKPRDFTTPIRFSAESA